jgi:hypothetical protein
MVNDLAGRKYDAYIHINGVLKVKCMPFGNSVIDLNSPFVKEYLGETKADNYEEAEKYFYKKIEEGIK